MLKQLHLADAIGPNAMRKRLVGCLGRITPTSISSMLLLVATLVWWNGLNHSVLADWPSWNGPKRTGEIVAPLDIEKVIAKQPERQWEVEVGLGYSGPAVLDGRVYVADYVVETGEVSNFAGTRVKLGGRERLRCFDSRTGAAIWTYEYPCGYDISYPAGPRTTPTVDGDLVYFLGAEGELSAVNRLDGKLVWKLSLPDTFDCPTPVWGFAATPLIHGDNLISLAGGQDSMVVCLDKRTGETIWTSLTEEWPGCCSPTIIRAGGVEQLLIWGGMKNLYSLNPTTGETYWTQPLAPGWRMSIAPPLRDGNRLFVSGERHVGAMYRLHEEQPGVDVLWEGSPKTAVYFAMATGIFEDGFIYGCDATKGTLMCVNADDGLRVWETSIPTTQRDRPNEYGSAFLSKLGEHTLILSENGDFIVAKLSPDGYQEISRERVIEPDVEYHRRQVVWSYPAYADGRMFVRNMSRLVAIQIE